MLLHYYTSLESFLKAKWEMMRRPKKSTIRADIYEIRPRADKHGVDLVSDALPLQSHMVSWVKSNQRRNRPRQVSQPLTWCCDSRPGLERDS